MRLVLIGLLLLLLHGLQRLQADLPADVGARAALIFGFLLVCGFLVGELAARAVPRITGYLVAGVVLGPSGLGLVDAEVVEHLELVDQLALVLIGLTAGAELKLSRLGARIRGVLAIALSQTGLVFFATGGSLWLLAGSLPALEGLAAGQRLAVACLLGLVAAATSPAATVAVIVETGARGPLADTVLGTVVVKDILILVGFSLLLSLSVPAFGPGSIEQPGLGWLLLEVAGSLGGGALFGGLMVLYLRLVGRQPVVFVLASAFLLISLARAAGLDPLLGAVTAGFVAGNSRPVGERFLSGLERAAGPVFLVFFCLAGAGLQIGALAGLWRAALLYIALRAVFLWLGTWLGAGLAGEAPPLRRWAWAGFLGQAGVSLGLAAAARSAFGPGGGPAADLIVAGVVLHELIGPIALRWVLRRCGEAGGRDAGT